MTLEELAAATGLTANDLIGIWDAEASGSTEPTQKLTAQQLAAAVKGLANLIGTSDLDSVPTQGSNNAVKSGGVYNAIAQSTANLSHIIVKPYSIALTANSYVAPFTHFGSSSLPYTHNLGEIISVTSRNTSAVANFDRGQARVTVVGTNVTSVIIDVVFATNVETKPID